MYQWGENGVRFVCMVHVFSLCVVYMENKWSLVHVYGICAACGVCVLCDIYV